MSNGILNYFGTEPTPSSIGGKTLRLLRDLIVLLIVAAVVITRAALLACGFACVFVGTLLLTLGGTRSAAVKVRQWRARAAELIKLWIADILRPLRRRANQPLAVLPV